MPLTDRELSNVAATLLDALAKVMANVPAPVDQFSILGGVVATWAKFTLDPCATMALFAESLTARAEQWRTSKATAS